LDRDVRVVLPVLDGDAAVHVVFLGCHHSCSG
jgi:hypothetical protein